MKRKRVIALFTPAQGEPYAYEVGGTVLGDGSVLLDNSYDPIPFDDNTMKYDPSQEANAGHCWEWHQAPEWEVQCQELCFSCETLLQP